MAQHDYVISNGTGAAVRSDLNNALAAIVSNNSGSTEPATTYAYMPWADTTTGLYKIRNSANNAWITLYQLDGEWSTLPVENGTAAAPSIYFKDSGTDTGFYSPGTDQVAISTGGTGRLFINSSGLVGVGTSSPSNKVTIYEAAANPLRLIQDHATSSAYGIDFFSQASTPYTVSSITASHGAAYVNPYLDINVADTSRVLQPRLRIDASGRVGVGTQSPDANSQFHVVGTSYQPIYCNTTNSGGGGAVFLRSGTQALYVGSAGSSWLSGSSTADGLVRAEANLIFATNGNNQRAQIDSSGRLLVGTSSARTNVNILDQSDLTPSVQFEGQATSNRNTGLSIINYSASSYGSALTLGASKSNTLGTNALVTDGGDLGVINFVGADGTRFLSGAAIRAVADGTTGAGDMPSRLVFSTTADGASSPTERMRINSDGGIVGGGNTSSSNLYSSPGFSLRSGTGSNFEGLSLSKTSTGWGTAVYIHRSFSAGDGTLIEFAHDTVTEGTISVSGTTVSYNGGHLSRWAQTIDADGANSLLKGTVLTNLNEMCQWYKEDGSLEDNEQLNKMAVSSIEGDPNVAGVLVSIDDDGDLNVGMTGDMIIRIAEGVTVERGDLLMSAGDGTAKPQDDDIIRSKTIAKVTSNHVTCTYEDGSYCVPCVLMAC